MMFAVVKNNVLHNKRLALGGLFLLFQVVLFTPYAVAQQAIIDERQEGFKKMGGAMKTLNGELKKSEPDSIKIGEATAVMATLAEEMATWFPAGSGPESGLETDALAYIWKGTEKFDRLSKSLVTETNSLATLGSGSDFSAIKKQLLVVRDQCSGCHDSYRAD